MCGIVGYTGARADRSVREVLLTGLSNLEYRGYDSAGVAIANGSLAVRKREGELPELKAAMEGGAEPVPDDGLAGIGHTRWSTHGPPSDANAHPHTDCGGRVAVVHNGIIENYRDLRESLAERGHEFESDTDTEVIPHLIEGALGQGDEFEAAFRRAVDRIEGSYAVAAVHADRETVHATRYRSPLVLGLDDDGYFLASDVPAFLEYTDRVVYLEDGQFASIRPSGAEITDERGSLVDVSVETIDWEPEDAGKSGYDHYMLKEIHDQPRAIRRCLRGRLRELDGAVEIDELGGLDRPKRVHFVACGTSYHASLYGARRFRERGIPSTAFLASEYDVGKIPIEEGTVVIGVTQSGETADTLTALREANSAGATTVTVSNVVGSSASREADHVLYIRAGPEISVAATKTFASQQVALTLLASAITGACDRDTLEALRSLPDHVQSVLDQSRAREIAAEYADAEMDAYFFIGRGYAAPVALEGALKLKEISYAHAEGFPAGELKHGPLALVTERTPVFAVVTGDSRAETMRGNINEVASRGAPVVAVTDSPEPLAADVDHVVPIPETDPRLAPILANVQLQLVAYWIARELGRSIDKPRNLAKSVTVQ
ncbi:glutamine--fructose-6-phosphate transaminase [Halobiforma haloterrestris]|uniref:Glutamine--fructose-6-phosphate aminotransferase [isomerizing] n=1 Tax=Natronobacterium haloterrestre TaxID=148448 RepID=A0A1I1KE89_NATHA|nr:glutamine--fructose-6-phosphate transaminase (isomerizing) [Halobiforma haloterrestris]SFC59274.1 glutamine--fructose-6-phosphate transaminase [Halobiforma haloterrestris]